MGEARNKRLRAESMALEREPLEAAVKKVSHALRRLAEAASGSLGGDCYAHAELGRTLLADQGFHFQTRVGFAAWRVGPGDGDVLSHTPVTKGYLPAGAGGMGLAYHAWLESGDWLADFTTYQLQHKCRELDAADGGRTSVEWCPEYLLLTRMDVRSYRDVAKAPNAGVAYYEASDELTVRMANGYRLDESDVSAARLILNNPNIKVIGPNSIPG